MAVDFIKCDRHYNKIIGVKFKAMFLTAPNTTLELTDCTLPPLTYSERKLRGHVFTPKNCPIHERIAILRSQKFSYRYIARKLNREGYQAPRGGKFIHTQVIRIANRHNIN